MSPRTRAYVGLTGAAFVFGASFVVIKDAVAVLPPLAFVGWRFLLGAVVLLLFARPRGRRVWIDGVVAGIVLFAGYATQTAGLAATTASNSGLITGLYVVFTPLLAAAVLKRFPTPATVAGAALAVVGLGLLTVTSGLDLNSGDVLTLLCAVFFAAHIVLLSFLAPRHAVVPFTAIQLLVVAVLGLVSSAAVEGFPLPSPSVIPALIATGVVVSAGAFITACLANNLSTAQMCRAIVKPEPGEHPFVPENFMSPAIGRFVRSGLKVPRLLAEAFWEMIAHPLDSSLFEPMTRLSRALPVGVFRNEPIRAYLEKIFSMHGRTDDFRELRRKLVVVATDLDSGRPVRFGEPGLDHVPISTAVQASTALPGLYPPVLIDGRYYVDGVLLKTVHASVALEEESPEKV